MKRAFFRRRKLIIYAELQWAVLFAGGAIVMASFLVSLLMLKSSYSDLVAWGREAGFDPSHVYFQFVGEQSRRLLNHLLLAFGFTFCGSVGFFLWFSHRVAGPLVRLRNYLNESNPDASDVVFREGDFFHDLAHAVNEAFKRRKNAD